MRLRLLALLALGLASPALADIAPDNLAGCRGKAAGAACTMDDGAAGVCTKTTISRPDYSQGVPPTYKQVEVLLCASSGATVARTGLSPLVLGVLLSLLAAGAAWWSLRRPKPLSA